ncbi:MAG: hypothetical protein IKD09_02450 [Lentisphaeria bacterium]|nr:hypothetical protein [Lentisphaeria bacterium]
MKLLYQKKSIEDIVNQTGLKKSRIYEIKTKLKEIANQKIKEHTRRQENLPEKSQAILDAALYHFVLSLF